jgi:hypothetical protein
LVKEWWVTAFDRLAKVGPKGWSKEGFYRQLFVAFSEE